ncbi:MAG: multiubiquitin domain-containing protein [Acidobacteria bacterium]|nr:multiubiquitin domain-containing protein [Acidobacteriota bacterium]
MSADIAGEKMDERSGPKYVVNVEGVDHDWPSPTITTADIRNLGGLPATDPVIEVDLKDNSERTLSEDEVIEIKPGMGFGKKVSFKRG